MIPGGFDIGQCKGNPECERVVRDYRDMVISNCEGRTERLCGGEADSRGCIDKYFPPSGPMPDADIFIIGTRVSHEAYISMKAVSEGRPWIAPTTSANPDLAALMKEAKALMVEFGRQTDPAAKVDCVCAARVLLARIRSKTRTAPINSASGRLYVDAGRLSIQLNTKFWSFLGEHRQSLGDQCPPTPSVEFIP